MADIPSNIDKMNDVEIAFDASVSEQLFNKLGANINALIDASINFDIKVYEAGATWTKPFELRSVVVFCTGGGGNGGTAYMPNNTSGASLGAGGGGGATAIGFIPEASLNPTETIVVGGVGGTSTFGAILTATGGASSGSNQAANPPVAAGGVATGGIINLDGSEGSNSSLPGTVTIGSKSGAGGDTIWGGGAVGVTATFGFVPTTQVGLPATGYGGGGSGGAYYRQSTSGTASVGGGAGRQGVVVVIELF